MFNDQENQDGGAIDHLGKYTIRNNSSTFGQVNGDHPTVNMYYTYTYPNQRKYTVKTIFSRKNIMRAILFFTILLVIIVLTNLIIYFMRIPLPIRRGCVSSSCDGFLENARSPFCSIGQWITKTDNVYDEKNVLIGIVVIYVSYSDDGPSTNNSDCISFWGGFRASIGSLQNVHVAAGISDVQYEQGPEVNLRSGQWASSYMHTYSQDSSCQSAWVWGTNSSDRSLFSHKVISNDRGC
jgi:hypothetical protein